MNLEVYNPGTDQYRDVSTQYPLPASAPPRAASTADVHAPAANTAAVVSYAAAGVGVSHAISGIAWSYSADPSAGNLKVEDGAGNVVLSLDVTQAGPGFIPLHPPKRGSANTALTVTLAAGGAGVTGKLSVLSHWTE